MPFVYSLTIRYSRNNVSLTIKRQQIKPTGQKWDAVFAYKYIFYLQKAENDGLQLRDFISLQ